LTYAKMGAALTSIDFHAVAGDLVVPTELAGSCQLVTCNAPIPGDPDRAIWRAGTSDFMPRMFEAAAALLAPSGMVVVHGALDALLQIVADLPGERVVVTYTPEAVRGFAIAWWVRDAPNRVVISHRELTAERPH